jgi:hypothetical protein
MIKLNIVGSIAPSTGTETNQQDEMVTSARAATKTRVSFVVEQSHVDRHV